MSLVAARERGQVVVMFAIAIPMFLALCGFVIGIGNWFVHAKHLQTKADAGALAGGGSWGFPCHPDVDARIAAMAREYAGSLNPQVGGVPNASVHTVLNGSGWYDDDSNPFPTENLAICNSMQLDVKVTEDNSFPLASLIPLFPDIKRRAKVELREVESATDLLPIAMRAPVPLSAAVFYNETTGGILGVRYFVRDGSVAGLPAGLQGWSTNNPDDPGFVEFNPAHRTGVAIAISFRDACDTGLPDPNNNIPVQESGPCFEDNWATIGELCNQGSSQIVNCYYATGSHPNELAQAGLHFIRGYTDQSPGTGIPAIESAHLENIDCLANAYYNWQRTPTTGTDCRARLVASIDVGTLRGDYGTEGIQPLRAQDIEVRFRLVRGDGTAQCNFNSNCDLNGGGGSGPTLTYRTMGTNPAPHLLLRSDSRQNAVALRIRIKNSTNSANPDCRANGFNDDCQYYYLGDGLWTGATEVPPDAQILARPIQRAFRGNTVNASSVQWLRLTQDEDCNGSSDRQDTNAASALADGCAGFGVEMGLKGGVALDVDEPPIIFTDGVASSKTGILHCDPAVNNGQSPIVSVRDGCAPWYAPHSFDPMRYATSGLCPHHNSIFQLPNPGPPWDDWPPLTCVKTRNTSQNNQMQDGLKQRFNITGNQSGQCPSDSAGFSPGRNYWDVDNNPLNAANPDPTKRYGYTDGPPTARGPNFHPGDPRLVTIFLVPTYAIVSDGGEKTYPIAGFAQVYITGYADLQNGGALRNGTTDPCPGNTPPPVSERQCQGDDCGFVAWGHILNWVIPSPGATPSESLCSPAESTQPCVAVLVE